MARIGKNHLVKGLRGNFSKEFVYKKRGADTHVASMPTVDKKAVITEKQEKVRDLFAEASLFAKGAITSPELKEQYEEKVSDKNTAFNVAFKDYTKAPVVKDINPEAYNGLPGSTIIVKAKDDFRVIQVKVSIHTADGVLLEEGNTILNPYDLNQWIYTATQANASLAGTVITATAFDIPRNKGIKKMTL